MTMSIGGLCNRIGSVFRNRIKTINLRLRDETCIAKRNILFVKTRLSTPKRFLPLSPGTLKFPKPKIQYIVYGFSIPFRVDFDLKIPLSLKIHSKSLSVLKADKLLIEMPIDAIIKPNINSDQITVEVYVNLLKPLITDEQRKWAESLEIDESTFGKLYFKSPGVRVSFSRKISLEPYPPAFCVIRIPRSLRVVEASMSRRSSGIVFKNTLLTGLDVSTEGGQCVLKNHHSDTVSIHTGNGDCRVDDSQISKMMTIDTGSGECHINNCVSSISVKTSSGSVHVSNSISTDHTVATESGDCVLTGNTSRMMAVTSQRGDCTLRSNKSQYLDAVTDTGTAVCYNNQYLYGEGCKSKLETNTVTNQDREQFPVDSECHS